MALGNVRYDLVGKLVEETGLTRATIAAILQSIAPLVFAQYKLNPEDSIIKAGKIINNQKADMIIEHITYNKLAESYSADIFMLANLHGRQGVNAMPADRSLYNYVIYDSDNERRFAHELDVCDKIAVYVKLPGSFFISTPVGKYNPDWAIAFHEGTVKHIYFIAETKGTTLLDRNELRGVEDLKIQCAKAHFAAISNDSVVSVCQKTSTLPYRECRGEHCSPANLAQKRSFGKDSHKANGHGRAMFAPTMHFFDSLQRQRRLRCGGQLR